LPGTAAERQNRLARLVYSSALNFRAALTVPPTFTALCRGNKKPTAGLFTEVGCLRCDLSFAYRAIAPHIGTLLQQQQIQAPR